MIAVMMMVAAAARVLPQERRHLHVRGNEKKNTCLKPQVLVQMIFLVEHP